VDVERIVNVIDSVLVKFAVTTIVLVAMHFKFVFGN
jgi:hypothetical protein